VTALLRYQAGILLRSHRWVFPLITYGVLISVGGIGQAQTLGDGLDWSAAMLVPVVALLTRSMLTAEPGAARACVAAAVGPRRAQLAVLLTALAGGLVLALAGAGYELLTSATWVSRTFRSDSGLVVRDLGDGLVTALVCVCVGSAIGTLCNAPVIRHQTVALLSTIAAVVLGLVSSISPASAALRGSGATVQAANWPTGVPLLAAVILLAVSWLVSALLAARRPG
jgi:hypothetical protein